MNSHFHFIPSGESAVAPVRFGPTIARPHPNPLPMGEGALLRLSRHQGCSRSTSRQDRVRWRCTSRCTRSAYRSKTSRCRSAERHGHARISHAQPGGQGSHACHRRTPAHRSRGHSLLSRQALSRRRICCRATISRPRRRHCPGCRSSPPRCIRRAAGVRTMRGKSTALPTGVWEAVGRSATPIRSPISICSGCTGGWSIR